ncbi:MAG: AMP-binding protein [Clostridia bacterium]|nr:AMP-binding protein [Clostridia bacterium]
MGKKNYPLYETTVFENFRVMTENAAAKFPNKIAISYRKNPKDKEAIDVTYTQMKEDIRNFGTKAIEMGLREKHVAIVGEATYMWVVAFFGLMSIGSVTIPIDKELPASEIADILRVSESSAVFYGRTAAEKIQEQKDEIPGVSTFVAMTGEIIDGAVSIESMIEDGKKLFEAGDNSFYDYEIDTEKCASIVFTSGTTGKGKGVMLSQKNIVSDMTQGMYNFAITPKTMMVLPPHHTFGSTVNLVGHLAQGCTVYISSGLLQILNELKEQKPSHLVLVPLFVETFYKRIWSAAEKQGKAGLLRTLMKVSNALRKVGIDLRKTLFKSVTSNFGGKLEMIISGGAALNQDIIDTFDAIGITILNGYGITECAPLISCNRNKLQKKGSVGTPIIGEQVKILDPDENGEGEICVKGPNVMLGYFKNEEATKAAFTDDGFFKTGDYGKLDSEGWIYITGRLKNLIIFSNGKNVYPEEIETEISRIEGVSEAVVYAGESKKDPTREVIVAEIFPDEEVMERRGITDVQKYFDDEITKINERTVDYKAVGIVKIRKEEFPKNTSKKIKRFEIDKSID